MEYVIIPAVALLASLLTFFSGFGLGTMLLPAFAVFFPVNVAVALTAIVHLFYNIFRFALISKFTDKDVILRFGLITALMSFVGAEVLSHLADMKPLFTYWIAGNSLEITLIKFIVAVMLMVFASWEVLPRLQKISFGQRYLPLGGFLSGFFGGLSGIQGPLRSAFLVRSGLSPEGYIATNAAIAIMVDIPRISVYLTRFSLIGQERDIILLVTATIAAFLGALSGNFWLKKVTMRLIQVLVSIMLLVIALALGAGFI